MAGERTGHRWEKGLGRGLTKLGLAAPAHWDSVRLRAVLGPFSATLLYLAPWRGAQQSQTSAWEDLWECWGLRSRQSCLLLLRLPPHWESLGLRVLAIISDSRRLLRAALQRRPLRPLLARLEPPATGAAAQVCLATRLVPGQPQARSGLGGFTGQLEVGRSRGFWGAAVAGGYLRSFSCDVVERMRMGCSRNLMGPSEWKAGLFKLFITRRRW